MRSRSARCVEKASPRRAFANFAASCAVGAVVVTFSAGCGNTTTGSARPASATATTASTSSAPAIVPTIGIKGKLLPLAQLGDIVGDTDMRPLASYTEPAIGTFGVDPFDCRSSVLVATADAYFQKARQAMVGDTNRGARGQVAAQVISVFASRAGTKPFVDSIASDWASCIRKGGLTVTADSVIQHWDPRQVEQTDARIALTVTRQEAPPRTCHHVVARQANIAVEVQVCGDGDTVAPATRLVDALLAKFPK